MSPKMWSIRARVERARAAHHAVDLVALLEQDLGEVRAVLARDPGDERLALHQRTRAGRRLAVRLLPGDRPGCAGRRSARSPPRSRRPA